MVRNPRTRAANALLFVLGLFLVGGCFQNEDKRKATTPPPPPHVDPPVVPPVQDAIAEAFINKYCNPNTEHHVPGSSYKTVVRLMRAAATRDCPQAARILSTWTALSLKDVSPGEPMDLRPVGVLTRLDDLNLSGNQIDTLAPLDKLTGLATLNLAGSQISLDELTYLPNVQNLNLSRIRWSGRAPQGLEDIFRHLTKLAILTYDGNGLTSFPTTAFPNTLVELSVVNKPTDAPLATLPTLNCKIERLKLSMQLENVNSITSITTLKQLDLSGNKIQALPADLTALTQLKTILLDDNRLTAVPRFPEGLEELSLSRNVDLAVLPADLGKVTRLHSTGTKHVHVDPLVLLRDPKLEELDLSRNRIPLTQFQRLGNLTRLQALYLGDNDGIAGDNIQAAKDALRSILPTQTSVQAFSPRPLRINLMNWD